MLNDICVMGRVVRDPEMRRTPNGKTVTTFSMACDRDVPYEGEYIADYFDFVAWEARAENIAKYFKKGRLIVVQGRLETRKRIMRDGSKRTYYEIRVINYYYGDGKFKTDGDDPGEAAGQMFGAAPEDFAQITDDADLPF